MLDKPRDRQKEQLITQLISGAEIVFSDEAENHPSQYPQLLYSEIYRVFKINGDPKEWRKDKKVADFTNEFFYGCRFGKDVLPTLRDRNKYLSYGFCIGARKHYHYFNDKGIYMLKTFIDQTIEVLESCTEEYEFRKKMFEQYQVPLQKDLFRN